MGSIEIYCACACVCNELLIISKLAFTHAKVKSVVLTISSQYPDKPNSAIFFLINSDNYLALNSPSMPAK